MGIPAGYTTHPTVLGLGLGLGLRSQLGLRLGLGLGLGLGMCVGYNELFRFLPAPHILRAEG